MKKLFTILFMIVVFMPYSIAAISEKQENTKETDVDVAKIYGRIKFVSSHADYKVKIVDSFPDLKVKVVDNFADDAGKWKIVDFHPDYKIQIVESFPDFTIKFVDSFPGKD